MFSEVCENALKLSKRDSRKYRLFTSLLFSKFGTEITLLFACLGGHIPQVNVTDELLIRYTFGNTAAIRSRKQRLKQKYEVKN